MRQMFTVIALMIAFGSVGYGEDPATPAAQQKWEYKVVDSLELNQDGKLVENLNELGEQGWELSGVLSAAASTASERLIFKRKAEPIAKASISLGNGKFEVEQLPDLKLTIVRGNAKEVSITSEVTIESIPELDILVVKGSEKDVHAATALIETLNLKN